MVLSEHDTPNFSLDVVRQALEIRLAEMLDRPLHDIQAGLAGLEAGIDIGDDTTSINIAAITQRSMQEGKNLSQPGTASSPSPRSPVTSSHPGGHSPASNSAGQVFPEGAFSTPSSADEGLPAWRHQSWQLARQLAERHGLEGCITASNSTGLGFFVDLPSHPIADSPAPSSLWWLLVGLSEQMAYLPHTDINHVTCMPDNELRNRVLNNHWDEIHARVGRGSSWINLPHLLETTEADTAAFMELFRVLRCLRRHAESDVWN